MSLPAPTRDDHEKSCQVEGWVLVQRAAGGPVRHHVTYELALPDGRVLRTRVSRPPDRTTYGQALWRHVLRDQLDVTEGEFWACVRGTPPARSTPEPGPDALPAELVHMLIHRVGLPEHEVASMTKAEAVERLSRYWTEGR